MLRDAHSVIIPCLGPAMNLFAQRLKKQIVKQPDMVNIIGVEATGGLEVLKETLPLGTNALCEVDP